MDNSLFDFGYSVPTGYWISDRRKISSWLNEQSLSLAQLYQSAVELINNESIPIPSRTRLVAHCCREICIHLLNVNLTNQQGGRLDYKKYVNKITQRWIQDGFTLDSTFPDTEVNFPSNLPSPSTDIVISRELYLEIAELIQKNNETTSKVNDRILQFYLKQFPENQNDQSLKPQASQWKNIYNWFVARAHDNQRVETQENKQELLSQFAVFESLLGNLARSFYSTTDEIDKILAEVQPTQEHINKAIALLPHPQQRFYFFNHLESPNWITSLKKKEFFQNPPDVINIPEDGAVRFPSWSESGYLARMAEYEPKAVLDIILKIETNNPRVHEDFVNAALQMPIEMAIQIAPKVKTWIQSPYSLFSLSEKIGDFTVYLAKNGKTKKSLILCRLLLAIRSDSESNISEANNYQANKFSLDSQIHMDYWYYKEILEKYVPELVELLGKKALKMVGYLLFDAIKFSQNSHKLKKQDDDLLIWEDDSRYWRPAIEEHSRNFNPHDFKELLTIAVRDAAEQIVEKNTVEIREIVQILEKWKWRIFHRIALYLIRKFPEADPELIAEELADPKYFDDSDYQDYEYAFLLKEHFANLSTESQQKILNSIENPTFDWHCIEDQEKKLTYLKQHWCQI